MRFLFFTVNTQHFQDEILIDAAGGAQPNISSGRVERIRVKFPKLSEQIQISERLDAAKQRMTLLEIEQEKYATLKSGLMQDLLTGKVRVKVG